MLPLKRTEKTLIQPLEHHDIFQHLEGRPQSGVNLSATTPCLRQAREPALGSRERISITEEKG